MANTDRLNALKATYFWRYATERLLYVFERVINVFLTNPLDRHDEVTRTKRETRPLPTAFHDLLGMCMRKRGKVTTESVVLEFVDRLGLRSSAYRSVPTLPKNAQPRPSKGMTQPFSLDEMRQLFSSRQQLTALEPAQVRSLKVPR